MFSFQQLQGAYVFGGAQFAHNPPEDNSHKIPKVFKVHKEKEDGRANLKES